MDGGVSSEPMARASCGLRAVRDMNCVGTPADDGSRYRAIESIPHAARPAVMAEEASEGFVIKTVIKADANILSGLPPGYLGVAMQRDCSTRTSRPRRDVNPDYELHEVQAVLIREAQALLVCMRAETEEGGGDPA